MLPSKSTLSAVISIAVFLVGCKADITANVALSELQGTSSYMDAVLSVEVPSCKEYDSDFESSSLLKLKSRVPVIFPEANFLGCKSIGFNTVANFSVPIRVGKIHEECSGHDICLGPSESQPSVIFAVAGKEKADSTSRPFHNRKRTGDQFLAASASSSSWETTMRTIGGATAASSSLRPQT